MEVQVKRHEIFTALKIQVVVFWIRTPPYSDVVGYQRFLGLWYFTQRHSLRHEDGGNMILRNVGTIPHRYAASQLQRLRTEY